MSKDTHIEKERILSLSRGVSPTKTHHQKQIITRDPLLSLNQRENPNFNSTSFTNKAYANHLNTMTERERERDPQVNSFTTQNFYRPDNDNIVVSPRTNILENYNRQFKNGDNNFNLKNLVHQRLSRSTSEFYNPNASGNNKFKPAESIIAFLDNFKTIKAHESQINCMIIYKSSEQEYIIATGGQDRDIKLWHYLTGEFIRGMSGHIEPITSLAKIRRKEYLISAGEDKYIKIWNFNTGRCVKTLQGHTSIIKKVIFIKWERNDSTLVTASSDKTIRIWNFETEICNIIKGHKHEVISLCQIRWLKDQTSIASGSWKDIKLWNIITGDNFATFSNNKNWIRNLIYLKYSPDTDYLVSASNSELKLWNLKSGKSVNTIDTEDSIINCIMELRVRNRELIVASTGSDKAIKIWNIESSKLIRRIVGHKDVVKGLAQPDKDDGLVLITASADRTIKYWK